MGVLLARGKSPETSSTTLTEIRNMMGNGKTEKKAGSLTTIVAPFLRRGMEGWQKGGPRGLLLCFRPMGRRPVRRGMESRQNSGPRGLPLEKRHRYDGEWKAGKREAVGSCTTLTATGTKGNGNPAKGRAAGDITLTATGTMGSGKPAKGRAAGSSTTLTAAVLTGNIKPTKGRAAGSSTTLTASQDMTGNMSTDRNTDRVFCTRKTDKRSGEPGIMMSLWKGFSSRDSG